MPEIYDPRYPEYHKVSDMPEPMRASRVDIPESKGGGFVERTALEEYEKARDEAAWQINKDGTLSEKFQLLLRPLTGQRLLHDRAMDRLQREAEWKRPVDQILEQDKIFILDEVYGEAWDKMREGLPNPEDRVYFHHDGQCGYLRGSIGGQGIDFHICGRGESDFSVDGKKIDSDKGWQIYSRVSDFAVDGRRIKSAVEAAAKQRKAELEAEFSSDPTMIKSKMEIYGEQKNKEREQQEEEERKRHSAAAASEILARIQIPKEK